MNEWRNQEDVSTISKENVKNAPTERQPGMLS